MANPARKTEIVTGNNSNVLTLGQLNSSIPTFSQLVVGDRFQPLYALGKQHPVYTKTRHDQARCHSLESTQLKKKGFGYLEDPIVAVDANEKIRFVPVE
jgi:hypothetical protein